jgi:steroid Delta-isomerase
MHTETNQAKSAYSPALQKAIDYFEHLSVEDVKRMSSFYSDDAYFKDPFNEVRGVHAITKIFDHMFVKVNGPRFVIVSVIPGENEAFLSWDFFLTFKGETKPRKIHGATHLKFASDGRIASHRDYWDAAEELYEKLPLVGSIMRFLKKQANK